MFNVAVSVQCVRDRRERRGDVHAGGTKQPHRSGSGRDEVATGVERAAVAQQHVHAGRGYDGVTGSYDAQSRQHHAVSVQPRVELGEDPSARWQSTAERQHRSVHIVSATELFRMKFEIKGKGSPYSIIEYRVPEPIPVLGSQPAGDVSHKPGSRLPLLFARPAVTLATLKRAATNFAAW